MVTKPKRSNYVPVGNLNPEQLAERRADELRRKQSQRARKAGKTLENYRENIVRKNTLLREKKEARQWEREIVANERSIRRTFGTDRKRPSRGSKKNPLTTDTTIKKAKRELRKTLKKKVLTDEEIQDLVIKARDGRVLPIETKRIYRGVQGHLNRWEIDGSNYSDPAAFLNRCKNPVKKIVGEVDGNRKFSMRLEVMYERANPDDDDTITNTFRTSTLNITDDDDFENNWTDMVSGLLSAMSSFQKNGSGWVIKKLVRLEINVDHYNPLAGRSWIPLPKKIAAKKAVVNLKNTDNKCFPLSVAVGDMINKNTNIKNIERIPKILRSKAEKLNMDGIPLPTKLNDIGKFETQNPGYNINVFTLDDNENVVPVRVKKRSEKNLTTIRLPLWGDMNGNFHYSPVKNMSALVSSQISTRKTTKFICDNCCNPFGSQKLLDKHERICYTNDGQHTILEDKTIEFTNTRNAQRVPFAIYADTEAFNVKLDSDLNQDCEAIRGSQSDPNTVKLSEQKFNDGGYVVVGPDGFDTTYKKFDGIKDFVNGLVTDIKNIRDLYFTNNVDIVMTNDDEEDFAKSHKCYQCKRHLTNKKVRDHDHFTGKYRGAACTECNLAMKKPKFIPVFFHNLEGYDSHMIIREIAKHGEITCIPKNNEQYISFSLKIPRETDDNKNLVATGIEVRFLDSFKFLGKGLGDLVQTLERDDFKLTNKLFPNLTDGQRELLHRKGVYPYDWMDSTAKLEYTELPPIGEFHNSLGEKDCDDDDYQHAQKVWISFGMRTFREYHDLYLKTDILFLADIMEKFRRTCNNIYGLDPAWYYTTPGLSWDCMMKMTGAKLQTVGDVDKHMFIESATRGGISTITKRHFEANHKYMDSYNPEKPSAYIMDLDRNNLYGEAMSAPLPTGNLEWMTEEELAMWEGIPCFLEVDVEYPRELHDDHNDYPFLCEKMVVNDCEKLVPNLRNKHNYVCHYSELKLATKHGLKITKIHRGLKFDESPWLQSYIDFNTKLRAKSKSDFEKDFYKLMNNSVFGKTMENVRNRIDVKLATTKSRLNKLIGMPNYKYATNFENGPDTYFSAVNMGKPIVKLNKPIYVGASVLSISKCSMYEFFYEYVKPKWGDNVKLLFTDTDSLCLEILTKDFYADTAGDVDEHFDTSDYPKNHPAATDSNIAFPVGRNKKVLGKMKDELKGKNILEFVGLRPKMYAIRTDTGKNIKRGKGIKEYVLKRIIKFDDYKRCLFNNSDHYQKQNMIRNRNHKIYVERVNKKALNGDDDKRIILPGNINTLAIGHWRHFTKSSVAVLDKIPIPGNTGSLYDLCYRKLV